MKMKRKTGILRVNMDFSDLIKEIKFKKQSEQKREIKSSRITQAMFNQYKKYPNLLKELERADLK